MNKNDKSKTSETPELEKKIFNFKKIEIEDWKEFKDFVLAVSFIVIIYFSLFLALSIEREKHASVRPTRMRNNNNNNWNSRIL